MKVNGQMDKSLEKKNIKESKKIDIGKYGPKLTSYLANDTDGRPFLSN